MPATRTQETQTRRSLAWGFNSLPEFPVSPSLCLHGGLPRESLVRCGASGAEDEVLDDRGQLKGRVALQAVAGFLDVNDLGGRQAAQQFPLIVVV